ncbi:MAG: hypothetical protein ACE5IG_03720 [Dehalococcoidia bacterium]
MSSKRRRVAARQAQLSHRKRHAGPGPVIPPPTTPRTEDRQHTAPAPQARVESPRAAPSARPQPALRAQMQSLITAEMRRIGIVAGLIAIIFVVLSFVLR